MKYYQYNIILLPIANRDNTVILHCKLFRIVSLLNCKQFNDCLITMYFVTVDSAAKFAYHRLNFIPSNRSIGSTTARQTAIWQMRQWTVMSTPLFLQRMGLCTCSTLVWIEKVFTGANCETHTRTPITFTLAMRQSCWGWYRGRRHLMLLTPNPPRSSRFMD